MGTLRQRTQGRFPKPLALRRRTNNSVAVRDHQDQANGRKALGLADLLRISAQQVGDTGRLDRDIHFVRVQCKRMLAALRILKPLFQQREFDSQKKQIRTVARSFGRERDSFVILKQLTAITSRLNKPERDQLRRWASGHIRKPDALPEARKLNSAKSKLIKCLNCWPALDASDLSPLFDKAVKKSLREIRKGSRRTLKKRKDKDFHDWRTSVKTLFLQMQLARDLGFRVERGVIPDLDALQRALGNVNDLRLAIDFINSFGNCDKLRFLANARKNMFRKKDKSKQKSVFVGRKLRRCERRCFLRWPG